MTSADDVSYSKITPQQIQQAALSKPVWSLLLDDYTRRLVYFEKGYRIAIYHGGLTTAIFNDDLPPAMTTKNCGDYRLVRDRLIFSPQDRKGKQS